MTCHILQVLLILLGLSQSCVGINKHIHSRGAANEELRTLSVVNVLKQPKGLESPSKTPKGPASSKSPDVKKAKKSKAPKASKLSKASKDPKDPKKSKKPKKLENVVETVNTVTTSLIVYSTSGLNADAISANTAAQQVIGDVLKKGLSDFFSTQPSSGRRLALSVQTTAFGTAEQAFPGAKSANVTYTIVVTGEVPNVDLANLQSIVNRLATDGVFSELFKQFDQSGSFGFSASAAVPAAIYGISLLFEYDCTDGQVLGDGVDRALKSWHETLNERGNQGFSYINIVNLEIDNGECVEQTERRALDSRHGRSLRGFAFSVLRYFLPVQCRGVCPSQPLPPISSINRLRRLTEYQTYNDSVPLPEVLENMTLKETGIQVQNITTNEDENGIIGCVSVETIEKNSVLQAFGAENCTARFSSLSSVPSVTPTIPLYPSVIPSVSPSKPSSVTPSVSPSKSYSVIPSVSPSKSYSVTPSVSPSKPPSVTPSVSPSKPPSVTQSVSPSKSYSVIPSVSPSKFPSVIPSVSPSKSPSVIPSVSPSKSPSSSVSPSKSPSVTPTISLYPSASKFPSVLPSFVTWEQLGNAIEGELGKSDEWGALHYVNLAGDGKTVVLGQMFGNCTVRVYKLTGNDWQQVGQSINATDICDPDKRQCVSVSEDGSVIAIGADYVLAETESDDNRFNDYAARARVYFFDSGKWKQRGSDIDKFAITSQGSRKLTRFSGSTVTLSSDGNTIAVGSSEKLKDGYKAGFVEIYEIVQGQWINRDFNMYGNYSGFSGFYYGDFFGISTSLSKDGNTIAVGSIGTDFFRGHVEVWYYDGHFWVLRGSEILGELYCDFSGVSVSLSDNGMIVAIGAIANSGVNGVRSGHTRVYEFANGDWTQRGDDIDGESSYDSFGISVSLSGDGNTVAVGAASNYGDNESETGHTQVFRYKNAVWEQLGLDIDGEAAYDSSGSCVSLSTDGQTVAVGSPRNRESEEDLIDDVVRVFRLVGQN